MVPMDGLGAFSILSAGALPSSGIRERAGASGVGKTGGRALIIYLRPGWGEGCRGCPGRLPSSIVLKADRGGRI